jgi:hypothetical protein
VVPCCVVNMDEADTSKVSSRYSIVVPRDRTTSLQMVYSNVPLAFCNSIRASSLVLDTSTSNILRCSFSGPSWLRQAISLASSRVFMWLKALAFVTARLGPGPNEGSMVVITRSFLTEPRMFCPMSPRIMLLETRHKLVELV